MLDPIKIGFLRFIRDRAVRDAFAVFILTRLLILATFVIVPAARMEPSVAAGFNPNDPHAVVALDPGQFRERLRHTLDRGDALWYVQIARDGYERVPFDVSRQHNWVFFPLYPVLLALLTIWTDEYLIAGALLSNALFFLALILLHKLVTSLGEDEATANRAVFYTAVFPVSYFFSLPITESLFLCLIVGSFLAAARGRWWLAGLIGGAASATRLAGLVLGPTLALFRWQRKREGFWRWDLVALALTPLGLLAFMLHLWDVTGNPFAFKDVVVAWQRPGGLFLLTLWSYLEHPLLVLEPWDFRLMNFSAALLTFGVAIFWAWRKHWAFAAYSLLAIIIPLSSGTLHSTTRYVAVIFPVFIALAIAGRRPRVDQALRIVFLILLGIMTLSFALRYSFAAA